MNDNENKTEIDIQNSIVDNIINLTDDETQKLAEDHVSKHFQSPASSITNIINVSKILSPDTNLPMVYRTPSKILTQLNVDKVTHADTYVSISTDESETTFESEHTLAIIKPAVMQFQKEIEKRIYDEGFQIIMRRKVHLSPEQVAEFYASMYGTLQFPCLVVYMSSAPVMVYCLARTKAIHQWNRVIGPTDVKDAERYWPSSLRATYGKYDTVDNALHGSADLEAAHREIRFFFPSTILEPLALENVAVEYLNMTVNTIISKGLVEVLKVKPYDPVLWFADWLLRNNPYRPQFPEAIARTKT